MALQWRAVGTHRRLTHALTALGQCSGGPIAVDEVLAGKVLEAVKSVLADSGLSFGVIAFE